MQPITYRISVALTAVVAGFAAFQGIASATDWPVWAACLAALLAGVEVYSLGNGSECADVAPGGVFFLKAICALIALALTAFLTFHALQQLTVWAEWLCFGAAGLAALLAYGQACQRLFPPVAVVHVGGNRLISYARARLDALKAVPRGDPTAYFGGIRCRFADSVYHYLFVSSTGGGKTTLIRLLLQTLLRDVGRGKDHRAIVFDSTRDFVSVLAGMGLRCKIIVLNIMDARCAAWDILKDAAHLSTAFQIATMLIPKGMAEGGGNDIFWVKAARRLIFFCVKAFMLTGVKWTLRDVLNAMMDLEDLQIVLNKTPETAASIRDMDPRTLSGILETARAHLQEWEFVAAAWEEAPTKFSMNEWAKDEKGSILVLGNDPENGAVMATLNAFLLNRVAQHVLNQQESATRRTFFVLDEAKAAGRFDILPDLTTNARKRGGVMIFGFQAYGGWKELYGKMADELIEQCAHVGILRCQGGQESGDSTPQWASSLFGNWERRELRVETSQNFSSQGTSTTVSRRWERIVSPTVRPEELKEIPMAGPANGTTGVFRVPFTGDYWANLSGSFVQQNLRPKSASVPGFIPRSRELRLQPWTAADRERLGIAQETGQRQEPELIQEIQEKSESDADSPSRPVIRRMVAPVPVETDVPDEEEDDATETLPTVILGLTTKSKSAPKTGLLNSAQLRPPRASRTGGNRPS